MSFWSQDLRGQSMVEYTLILLLIALVLLLVVAIFGLSVSNIFSQIISAWPP